MKNNNLILDLCFEFAMVVIEYCEVLEEKRKYVIANQLLKSGTSIGANIMEAQSAESKADFIHKFKIADKEIIETEYWMKLCEKADQYPSPSDKIFNQLFSIKNIVSKIIITSKRNG